MLRKHPNVVVLCMFFYYVCDVEPVEKDNLEELEPDTFGEEELPAPRRLSGLYFLRLFHIYQFVDESHHKPVLKTLSIYHKKKKKKKKKKKMVFDKIELKRTFCC